jgi:5,5'-dehydrodivanillate O-demethylase oxygenase subunit
MVTKETNERMTQTGADTPGGRFLRRYWWPIASLDTLDQEPVQPVRLLSEDLTLFKDLRGNVGLIAERCAHRGISLAYGIPQVNGLRCAYHGWIYDTEGRTVDTPFEPTCLHIKIKAYPVQELGGLIFAYLGPEPAPLLPRWEGLVSENTVRAITNKLLPCNWLQCIDNALDPVHFEHLHGHYGDYYNQRHSLPGRIQGARHHKIEFDVEPHIIYKRRLVEGEPENSPEWTVGHPMMFPSILSVDRSYQYRIPIDDTHTMHTIYAFRPLGEGEGPQTTVPSRMEQVRYSGPFGLVDAPWVDLQDEMAWIGQGPVSDRTQEHLASSDKGLILFHDLILENIDKVERGEDPMGVIRDPAENEPFIELRKGGYIGGGALRRTGAPTRNLESDRFAWAGR